MGREPTDAWFEEQLKKMSEEEIREGIKSTLRWLKETREALQKDDNGARARDALGGGG